MRKLTLIGAVVVLTGLAWLGHEETNRASPHAAPAATRTTPVTITGSVVRPGVVQLAPGETFARAIEHAGGPQPYAKMSAVYLVRDSGTTHRRAQPLDMTREFTVPSPRAGDRLFVPERLDLALR
ncbi:MAG: SLBB domain-containing protein [Candidatus Didemnitutus sp.]|nr:SLBB domain-containing protein [Candidatus Didemnitutus sp.]